MVTVDWQLDAEGTSRLQAFPVGKRMQRKGAETHDLTRL